MFSFRLENFIDFRKGIRVLITYYIGYVEKHGTNNASGQPMHRDFFLN